MKVPTSSSEFGAQIIFMASPLVVSSNAPEVIKRCKATLVRCEGCGQNIRAEDFEGNGVCPPCYEAGGLENEHSDSGHPTWVDGCPTCESPAAYHEREHASGNWVDSRHCQGMGCPKGDH
jgi:hypothetical protein